MTALVTRRRKKTAKETAAHVGVSVRTIQRWIAEERTDYQARATERRRIAGTLHEKGATWAEIAEALGATEWAARALVRRHKQEKANKQTTMTTLNKDLKQPLTQDTEKAATQPTSTNKQQDESHQKWREELYRKAVEASKRMETDPEYRRKIQSMTH